MFNVSVPPLSAPIITGGRDYYTEVGLHDGSVEFHFFLVLYDSHTKKNSFLFVHGSLQDRIGDTKCPTRFVNGFQYYLP